MHRNTDPGTSLASLDAEHPLAHRLRQAVRFSALGVAAFGVFSLIMVDQSPSQIWHPAVPGALVMVLGGAALYFSPHFKAWRAGLGLLALLSVLAGGILSLAGVAWSYATPLGFTMSLLAAVALPTVASQGWRGRLGWLAALAVLVLNLFILIDYLFALRVVQLIRGSQPLPAAMAYTLLALGLLLSDGSRSPMAALTSTGPGGFMTRRLLLPALVLPLLLLGLLRLVVDQNVLGLDLAYNLVTCLLILSLAGTICYQARALDRLERRRQGELAQAEADYLRRINLALDAGELYLWEADVRSGLLRHSHRYLAQLGYRPEEAGTDLQWWLDRVLDEDRDTVRANWDALRGGARASARIEVRVRNRQGELHWHHIRARAVEPDADGRPTLVLGALMDVTERKREEQQLAEARAKLQLAVEIALVGFWQVDLVSGAVYYSPEWKRQLGYEDDEIPNDAAEWRSRLHPDDREAVLERMAVLEAAAKPGYQTEFRLRHKDGSYRWIASRAVVQRDSAGTPVKVTGIHLDISERKEIEERIRRISQHDPLTGLPNRSLLHEFAQPMLANARRDGTQLAVMFIDLDRFKAINDDYGHAAGDAVLREVARRLRSSIRESDLVARLGGDEFLVVLGGLRFDEAAARVARLCIGRLGRPYRYQDWELHTTPSIGISLFPRDGDDIDSLIRSADAAMYEAKHAGRNDFRFYRPGLMNLRAE